MNHLLLFDIDGTLVSVRREVARRVVADMVAHVTGHRGELPELEMHGKTDRQIIGELHDLLDLPADDRLRFADAMERRLVEAWRNEMGPDDVLLLPSVRELLERLAARADVTLGLVTGNLEESARLKLEHHRLNSYFRFGAFGSDSADRRELPPLALERACASTGRDFHRSRVVIIGDSHRDIDCARASGMRAVAVATGSLTRAELAAHSPDVVVDRLDADDAFLSLLLPDP